MHRIPTRRPARRAATIASALAVAGAGLLGVAQTAGAHPGFGHAAVFTETNTVAGNAVVAFDRAPDGSLTQVASYLTGGTGTGASLGSQGAIALDGDLLLAVDAGSNDIAVFRVRGTQLRLVDREPSGGTTPSSITVQDDLVEVLNAGGVANVTGFRLGFLGRLYPTGSTQPLSAGAAGPAEVAFTPNGDRLVVTEKASSTIDTFAVDWRGRVAPAVSHASSGSTPFGFDFAGRDTLVVSEAAGGPAGTSAVSSYSLRHGGFTTVSASSPDALNAACWVVATRDGRYAFTANAASDTISTDAVASDGSLTLVHAGSGLVGAGAHPTDEALSGGDGYLYTVDALTHQITGFAVGRHGDLGSAFSTPAGGLPASAVGIAAS